MKRGRIFFLFSHEKEILGDSSLFVSLSAAKEAKEAKEAKRKVKTAKRRRRRRRKMTRKK